MIRDKFLMQGAKLSEKEKVSEVKRRIRALLPNVLDSECESDGIIINTDHSIHFTIRNKDYLLKGTIMKRVA